MPLTVMLCCNDYRNGNYLGYVESIEIEEITLEGARMRIGWDDKPPRGAKSYEGEATLRIGRLRVPALSYKTWVGNWCWDAAWVRGIHALRILNFLAAKEHWHCTEAPCEVYEAFNDRRIVTVAEWKRCFNICDEPQSADAVNPQAPRITEGSANQ